MNSTSIFHVLSAPMPGPTMPVDVAMQLYIAHSPPLRSFLSSYEECRGRSLVNAHCYKPLRPCLSSRCRPHLDTPCLGWQTPKAPAQAKDKDKDKKRVVFADSKGMSLTAVHLFSNAEDAEVTQALSQLQFDLTELENATATLRVSTSQSLTLDFPQPSADYLDFRSRLLKNAVCLENCMLQERSLTGTVKVRNLAFEKSVQVRVTFDSWRSLQDVECTFMNNVYGCQETDTFSFAVELPGYVVPGNRVEFCICYRTAEQTFWDNNDGNNYRLLPAPAWKNNNNEGKWSPSGKKKDTTTTTVGPRKPIRKLGSQFERLANPRTSSGLFTEWQAWDCIENGTPYW